MEVVLFPVLVHLVVVVLVPLQDLVVVLEPQLAEMQVFLVKEAEEEQEE